MSMSFKTNINGTKGSYIIMKNMRSKKETSKLLELGLQALIDNHFNYAITCFRRAALCGNKLAHRYHMLLRCEKDKSLARDLILCAERRV
jgi:hypothetical protein